jgi:multiple sugar transport system permease protein
MATTALGLPAAGRRAVGWSPETTWGAIMVTPYILLFLAFVVWPVAYGVWLGADPQAYRTLLADPIYLGTAWNTAVFLGVGINLKLFLALLLSGFFAGTRPWIRWLSVLFILPWAVPSIPTIFSIRWMLNSEWGMLNGILWQLFGIEGPWWLVEPHLAFGAVIATHIWKYLPFWTLILLAGRMAIPTDLYEAATIDGASPFQKFRYVTWPNLKNLYITSTLLSTIWSLGDFNSVYLLTGGGPADLTHVLATLGIRYIRLDQVDLAMATIVCAMPLVLPLVYFMMKNLSRPSQ